MNINTEVFTVMDRSDVLVALGTKDYGEDTGSAANTVKEVSYWETNCEETKGKLLPIRLIGYDEKFTHVCAKRLFTKDALQIGWDITDPTAVKQVVVNIWNASKGHAHIQEKLAKMSSADKQKLDNYMK